MKTQGTKYRLFIATWALATLFLCIGSLVHFHIWKIYSKPLLSEMVISKREQNDLARTGTGNIQVHSGSGAVLSGLVNTPCFSMTWEGIPFSATPSSDFRHLSNTGLRAPPLA